MQMQPSAVSNGSETTGSITIPSSNGYAIEAHDIQKHYNKGGKSSVHALRGVSLQFPRGKICCILGPNGAGKSTLIKILTTITRPDSGTASIEGFDIQKEALQARERVGVVFQRNHFHRYLNIWQMLVLHAQMHGLSRKVYEPKLKDLLDQVGLYDRRFGPADALSGGQQRRISIVRALIHDPTVLFLDEPTTGVDPQVRRELWETIGAMRDRCTIVLTTHYMEEAERLSDFIYLMHQGKIVNSGTPQSLKETLAPQNLYRVQLNRPVATQMTSHEATRLASFGIEVMGVQPDSMTLRLKQSADIAPLLQIFDPHLIRGIGPIEPTLEDVFLSIAEQGELSNHLAPGCLSEEEPTCVHTDGEG